MDDMLTSIPASRSLAGARARGYSARLSGESVYSNPYGNAVEQRQESGKSLGWLGSYLTEWWRGWHAADEQIGGS